MRRRDLILPALLTISLAAMVVYARSGGSDASQLVPATTVACQDEPLVVQLARVPESSGLAASTRTRNLFWSHNDSGDPSIYGIRPDGSVIGQVRVAGASVVDWEAVTVAPCDGAQCLYIGDIGDNELKRREIVIYRTREPLPGDAATPEVGVIRAQYPEGPQDAEALFFADGTLFVVTKGEGAPIRVYRVPSLDDTAPQTLQLVATLTERAARKSERVTDAAASPSGRWIALRTNDAVLFYPAAALTGGQPGAVLAHELTALGEPQGEGIAWSDERTLYLSGEGTQGGTFSRISCTLP
jgi:hypothetical protein